MFAAVLARPEMSPSEQFLFLADKIDKGQQEVREQISNLQNATQSDRHAFRNEIQAGFGKVQTELAALRAEVTGTDKRLLVVETERRGETQAATRRATWISLAIGVGWSVLQFLFGWLEKK